MKRGRKGRILALAVALMLVLAGIGLGETVYVTPRFRIPPDRIIISNELTLAQYLQMEQEQAETGENGETADGNEEQTAEPDNDTEMPDAAGESAEETTVEPAGETANDPEEPTGEPTEEPEDEKEKLIRAYILGCTVDDYDRLIQLCDALAGSENARVVRTE